MSVGRIDKIKISGPTWSWSALCTDTMWPCSMGIALKLFYEDIMIIIKWEIVCLVQWQLAVFRNRLILALIGIGTKNSSRNKHTSQSFLISNQEIVKIHAVKQNIKKRDKGINWVMDVFKTLEWNQDSEIWFIRFGFSLAKGKIIILVSSFQLLSK